MNSLDEIPSYIKKLDNASSRIGDFLSDHGEDISYELWDDLEIFQRTLDAYSALLATSDTGRLVDSAIEWADAVIIGAKWDYCQQNEEDA